MGKGHFMQKPILIPKLGDDVEIVKLAEWLVREGDIVRKGEPIAVLETEKVAFEVESPEDGVIEETYYSEGDKIDVSKPIAYLSELDEAVLEETPKKDQKATDEKQLQEKGFRSFFRRITNKQL